MPITAESVLRRLGLPALRALYAVRVVGRDNIPREGGALLVCNHLSFADAVLVTMASPRPVRFMMLRSYYELPIAGFFFRTVGCIPVASGDGPKALARSFEKARDYLRAGELVCVFAEGGISRLGQMRRFKKGFQRIMQGLDVPVIPVHLDRVWGSLFSFSKGRLFFKRPRRLPYPVTAAFGRAMPASSEAFAVRQAILELGAEDFRFRLEGSPPLPLAFARRAKARPFSACLADSLGARLNGISALTGAYLLGRALEQAAGAGPRVGVLLPPSVPAVLANAGLSLRGKSVVNLNYASSKEIVDLCAEKAGLDCVVVSRRFEEKLGFSCAARRIYLEDIAAAISGPAKFFTAAMLLFMPFCFLEKTIFSPARVSLDQEALVLFTSGSTGAPKGVRLSHANVLSNVLAVGDVLPLSSSDTLLGVLPFFHAFGLTCTMWLPLVLGFPAVYHISPLEPRRAGELCAAFKATLLVGTPTLLLGWLRRVEPAQFKTLRWAVVGAEPLRPESARAFREKFGRAPLEGYGATELSPVAAVNVPDALEAPGILQAGTRLGSVGRPLPGVFMKVVDPETRRELPAGEPGLLLVKGPNVMKGYLGDEALTREVLREGYYVTGDIARLDEDGFVELTDRLSRFSKIGGEMVPHLRVEQALQEASGLAEPSFAVAGVPDASRGERLVVFHKGNVDAEAVLRALRASGLPRLWIPDKADFHAVKEFPLLGIGKLDLARLKAEARRLTTGPKGAA